MADKRNAKRNNRNNKNYDEDYNPRFKERKFAHYVETKTLY